ncbi:MAG: PAC2 family protein [Methanomassiliicoccales archaeon]|nr:PAC2 family protein [Methanomassiliicoccales archaeon]
MEEIDIIERKKRDIQDAYVIDGFPSVGLVGSISANYLVNFLGLEEIAVMDSASFPAISLVKGGKPHSPVRIYAGQKGEDKVVVFVSEFPPPPDLAKSLAKTMMDWIQEKGCQMLISPEGLVVQAKAPVQDAGQAATENKIYGVGSTPNAMDILKRNGIAVFDNGVIVGLAGVLLNEGVNRDFDVLILLSEAHAEYPDARAAAAVTSAIDKILLHTELDTKPLLVEAAGIEERLKEIYKKAGKKDELAKMRSIMYG